jgi:hypothetical protein
MPRSTEATSSPVDFDWRAFAVQFVSIRGT